MIDLAVVFLGFALFAVGHSLLARPAVKEQIFQAWPEMIPRYRLTYSIGSTLALAAWFWLAPFPEGVLYQISPPVRWGLHLVQGVGLLGIALSFRSVDPMRFLGFRQPTDDLQANTPLVTGGLYRWVRHPLYTSSMIVMAFHPTMDYRWGIATLLFGLYFWIGSIFEEQTLISEFGERYRSYREEVPRFLPKINLF